MIAVKARTPEFGFDSTRVGLAQWLNSHSVESFISRMVKKENIPHWGSKGAINRAGEAIRSGSVTDEHALALEAWRMAHRDVIHTFEAMLRARARNCVGVQVAQRLKRRTTIVDKLARHPRMELARMDDVAGCRIIFPDVKSLKDFRANVHRASFKHVLKNDKDKYEYLKHPTARGYRGIHDVYECRTRSGESSNHNGLLIEIQYRTDVQHAWATAVEVVTQLTENEPKFDRGDRRHIRFFCLASEMLARAYEGMNSCVAELDNKSLIEEFNKLEDEIGVIYMLTNLAIHKWIFDRAKSDHIILQISKDSRQFKLHQFDLELEASQVLLDLEKKYPQDDIVLVGARSVEEVVSAFRNYFNDVGDFMKMMADAHGVLNGENRSEAATK